MGRTQTDENRNVRDASDEKRLASKVFHSIAGLGYTQLDHIECRADGDHVHLDGTIHSYYLKQIAQTVAMKIPGVRRVTNNITVEEESLNTQRGSGLVSSKPG